jgi:transcriptional regulator with XRE-family HTH domain
MPEARSDLALRFGRNLCAARRKVGLSQEELATLASLHRSEVSMLERGVRTPRLDTIVRLLGSLDAEPADFFAGLAWVVGGTRTGSFAVEPPATRPLTRLPRDPLRPLQ